MKHSSSRVLSKQVRHESIGLLHGLRRHRPGDDPQLKAPPAAPHLGKTSWSRKYDSNHEGYQSSSTVVDERVEALFGVDHHPWVHPVKETRLDGKQDPHRRTLWETALYAQSGDIRNDETHIWAQRVVQRAGMTDQMRQFSNTSVSADTYYGMYPETHKENPGTYWKEYASKFLYTHAIQEQEQARETERFGGEAALPTDDYQTHNGVAPFLSAELYNAMKYDLHEGVVRELNAANGGKLGDVGNLLSNQKFTRPELGALAARHIDLTIFWRSIRPRGGVLREEMTPVIAKSFGSPAQMAHRIVSEAEAIASQHDSATVALVYNTRTELLELISYATGGTHPLETNYKRPITTLILEKDYWSRSYDSVYEFAERYMQVYDWDYAAAAYAAAVGIPRPEPLVF